MADHLKKHKDIPEIPRSQRYAHRPGLSRIFSPAVLKDKGKRNRKIAEAVERYGYTQRAIADHLGMHFTYVSQLLKKI
jgi:alkanesulfonate monooxygenase SsuD/methylene tetrahydromethanopterin reductase-like flavin-dependent oxidoreductase (luciferase family)